MTTVTILDGRSLLARHVLRHLDRFEKVREVRIWNLEEEEEVETQQAACSANNNEVELREFVGIESLRTAIAGTNTVLNLHEARDFSTNPDQKRLNDVNFEFVKLLLGLCVEYNVNNLIHLSSIYIQCSPLWPNVYNREMAAKRSNHLFQPYVDSKFAAESLLMSFGDSLRVVSARVGALYGEGDVCSPVCDAVVCADKLGFLPVYGGRDNAFQITYAGNCAASLIEIANQCRIRSDIKRELVTIRDDTPGGDIYSSVLEPLLVSEERRLSDYHIHFFLLLPLWLLIFALSKLAKLCHLPCKFDRYPDPMYLSLLFYHWTFLSDFKQRIFFSLKPLYSHKESIERCRPYYRNLAAADVHSFSWQCNSL